MTATISTINLTKRYSHDTSPALDGLTISVNPGEVYGYLGANGAGKSTTIRLLMNFLQPTSGSATIAGFDTVTQSVQVRKHVGYLSGDVALYSKVTGRELLDHLARLQGVNVTEYRKILEKRFEAETLKPIAELSKGNRQKIGIIQALMHQPQVLILDEPTSGLDPLMQEVFYDSLREARSRGAAVLMSSHNLTEAQTLCDRIGILKQGKLIREQRVDSTTAPDNPLYTIVLNARTEIAKLKHLPHVEIISHNKLSATIRPKNSLAAALRELGSIDIQSLRSEQVDLEDEFLEFYGSKQ